MLIDTDILIWCFRGVAKAEQVIDADPDPAVSVVTWMELVQGCRDKVELRQMKSFFADVGIRTIPLSENIGHRAAIYLEEHALKDGMTMGDALIAATAMEHALALRTGNHKHFRVIDELDVVVFRPRSGSPE